MTKASTATVELHAAEKNYELVARMASYDPDSKLVRNLYEAAEERLRHAYGRAQVALAREARQERLMDEWFDLEAGAA